MGKGLEKYFRYNVVSLYRGFFSRIFHYYWGGEYGSLYRGLRYLEVRNIEALLYHRKYSINCLSRLGEDSFLIFDCDFFYFQLFVSAMGPPGGGRNDISGRFTRHLNIISIDSFDDNTMTKIFTSIVDWHFAKGFDASFGRLGKVSL